MRQRFFAIMFGASFLAGASGNSEAFVLPGSNDSVNVCTSCTEQQMRSSAQALGLGQHHYYDLAAGWLRAFSVTCDQTPSWRPGGGDQPSRSREVRSQWGCPGELFVFESPARQDVLESFLFVKDTWNRSGGTMKSQVIVQQGAVPVQGLGGATAMDIARDANLQHRVATFINDIGLQISSIEGQMRVGGWIAQNIIEAIFGQTDGLDLRIRIENEDGSYCIWSLTRQGGSFVDNSCTSPGGNLIPTTPDRMYGVWPAEGAGGYTVDQWGDYFYFRGIPVSGSGSSTLSCGWQGDVPLGCVKH